MQTLNEKKKKLEKSESKTQGLAFSDHLKHKTKKKMSEICFVHWEN